MSSSFISYWWTSFPVQMLFGFSLLFLTFFLGSSDGLRDVQLESNRYSLFGGDLDLRCNYNLENKTLYAVKWYRGSEEFYRYIPKLLSPKQTFPQRGIYVDYHRSNDHHVFIRNTSFETNGKYKCVVSVDGSFQTLSDSKDIDVVVIGHDSPILLVDKMYYQPEDEGKANCTTIRPTSPPVNITWFINDKLINDDKRIISTKITETDLSSLERKLSFTISTLSFQVPSDTRQNMKIKCVIQLYDVYSDASVTSIQIRGSSHSNSRSSNSRKHHQHDSLQHSSAQSNLKINCHWIPHPTILLLLLFYLSNN